MLDIGKRIKERRLELGLSAEDLAPMVGLSPATIYRYENGDIKKVNTNKLQPFAKALRTTESYLMGWQEENEAIDSYSIDENDDTELWELRETLRRNPEVRTLFSTAKNATPKQIRQAVAVLQALKASDDGED